MAHRGAKFSGKTKSCKEPIEQPVSNKRASLMGKLLIVCVDRLCLRLTKIRRDNLVKVTKRNSRKQLKNSLRVVAEKPQISAAAEKNCRTCAVTAEKKRAPKLHPRDSGEYGHTVGLYLLVPSCSNRPISIWNCGTTRIRI